MRKDKLLIGIFTALLVLVIVFVGMKESNWVRPIQATVSCGGHSERITVWNSYRGTLYVFLPGYAQLDQVTLHVADEDYFRIDGEPVRDAMGCGDYQLNVAYDLSVAENMGILSEYRADSIMFVRSETVSTMFVDVSSGTMADIHQDKEYEEPAMLRLYDSSGQLLYTGKADSVSGRGQSTWQEEKKSYNVRLMEAADLLGMGSAEKWILQANAMDGTNLKNKMVFDTAAAAGLAYSPDSRWVDLYLNGEYAGLYLLCERNEVHPERVDISHHGSFLVTKDREWRFEEQGDPYIMTDGNAALGIRYADMEYEQIRAIWQSLENAVVAGDGVDPVTGKNWQELLDGESWAKKYLLEELFGNTDGGVLSQYFYLDGSRGDGKVYAGPVWDYDLTLRLAPNEFCVDVPGIYGSPWFPALCRNAEFMELVKEQYAAVFHPLLGKLAEDGIEKYADQIAAASQMNALRWGVGDWEYQTETLCANLKARLAFFDRIWLADEPYVILRTTGYENDVRVYGLQPGSVLPELPEYSVPPEVTVSGWYYADTHKPVDPLEPIQEDICIVLRYETAGA